MSQLSYANNTSIALDNYISRINEQVQSLLLRLPEKESVVNLTDELKFYGFGVMAATTFSRNYKESQRKDIMRIMSLLESTQRILGILGHVPWAWSPLEYIPGALGSTSDFYNASERLLNHRLQVCSLPTLSPTRPSPCEPR